MSTGNKLRRGSATFGILALLTLFGTSPAVAGADSDDVDVTNTETVKVYMSPEGEIGSKRVYEQLAMTGNGVVNIANPISTSGLRNLDGFSGIVFFVFVHAAWYSHTLSARSSAYGIHPIWPSEYASFNCGNRTSTPENR